MKFTGHGFCRIIRVTVVVLLAAIGLAQESPKWSDPSRHKVQFVPVEDGVKLEILDWVYFDALNDGWDDYTDYDAVTAKLPGEMKSPPSSSPYLRQI